VPINRARELRIKSAELKQQSTETVRCSELIVSHSRALQRKIDGHVQKDYAAGASRTR